MVDRRTALRLALILLALACARRNLPERSVPGATQPALFGSWFRPEKGITDVNVQLWDLAESEGRISGSAVVNGMALKNPMGCPSATDGRYAVQGTRTADDVKLTIACPGYESLEFTGTIGNDAIIGVISGSGLPPRSYVFTQLGV